MFLCLTLLWNQLPLERLPVSFREVSLVPICCQWCRIWLATPSHMKELIPNQKSHHLLGAPLTMMWLLPHNPNLKFSQPEMSSLIFPSWCAEIAHCWSPNSGANNINCGEGLDLQGCLAACFNDCSVTRHIAQMLPCPSETSDWLIVVFSLSKNDKNVF